MRRRTSWPASRVAFKSWHKSLARSRARTSSGSSGSYSSPASILSLSLAIGLPPEGTSPFRPRSASPVMLESWALVVRARNCGPLPNEEGEFPPLPVAVHVLEADLPQPPQLRLHVQQLVRLVLFLGRDTQGVE